MASNRWIPTPDMLDAAVMGEVYFIEITPSFGHAQIYCGWARTGCTMERFKRHSAGQGARILNRAVAAGRSLRLIHIEPGTRYDERRLKGGHKREYIARRQ